MLPDNRVLDERGTQRIISQYVRQWVYILLENREQQRNLRHELHVGGKPFPRGLNRLSSMCIVGFEERSK